MPFKKDKDPLSLLQPRLEGYEDPWSVLCRAEDNGVLENVGWEEIPRKSSLWYAKVYAIYNDTDYEFEGKGLRKIDARREAAKLIINQLKRAITSNSAKGSSAKSSCLPLAENTSSVSPAGDEDITTSLAAVVETITGLTKELTDLRNKDARLEQHTKDKSDEIIPRSLTRMAEHSTESREHYVGRYIWHAIEQDDTIRKLRENIDLLEQTLACPDLIEFSPKRAKSSDQKNYREGVGGASESLEKNEMEPYLIDFKQKEKNTIMHRLNSIVDARDRRIVRRDKQIADLIEKIHILETECEFHRRLQYAACRSNAKISTMNTALEWAGWRKVDAIPMTPYPVAAPIFTNPVHGFMEGPTPRLNKISGMTCDIEKPNQALSARFLSTLAASQSTNVSGLYRGRENRVYGIPQSGQAPPSDRSALKDLGAQNINRTSQTQPFVDLYGAREAKLPKLYTKATNFK